MIEGEAISHRGIIYSKILASRLCNDECQPHVESAEYENWIWQMKFCNLKRLSHLISLKLLFKKNLFLSLYLRLPLHSFESRSALCIRRCCLALYWQVLAFGSFTWLLLRQWRGEVAQRHHPDGFTSVQMHVCRRIFFLPAHVACILKSLQAKLLLLVLVIKAVICFCRPLFL